MAVANLSVCRPTSSHDDGNARERRRKRREDQASIARGLPNSDRRGASRAIAFEDLMKVSRISIMGGGIGGLSAALVLQHFGYRVSVFEQARELREIGAGVTIHQMRCTHSIPRRWGSVAKEAGPDRGVPDTPFPKSGEVIKTRASGTDYVWRFGAAYHQVHRADLHNALAEAVLQNDADCVSLGCRLDFLRRIPGMS